MKQEEKNDEVDINDRAITLKVDSDWRRMLLC